PLSKEVDQMLVLPSDHLGSTQDDRKSSRVVSDFGKPFPPGIFKAGGGNHREHEHEDICLRIGERSQSVIVFLASGIPEIEVDNLAIQPEVCTEIIEHGWDVIGREGIGGLA